MRESKNNCGDGEVLSPLETLLLGGQRLSYYEVEASSSVKLRWLKLRPHMPRLQV